jgi:hypothetical protein
MVYKNKLSGLLIVLLASSAHAECYMRSTTVSQLASSIERTADQQRDIIPQGNGGFKCRISFRALIDNKWHTAFGEEIGDARASLDQTCAKAMNAARVTILESVSGTRVTGNQEMICTDKPIPESRPNVSVGDMVWESEVQPHPVNRNSFNYRGSVCRWFVESKPQMGRVDLNQGIICRSLAEKVWKVVDKW